MTLFSESVESFEREQEKSENKQNELRKKEKLLDFCDSWPELSLSGYKYALLMAWHILSYYYVKPLPRKSWRAQLFSQRLILSSWGHVEVEGTLRRSPRSWMVYHCHRFWSGAQWLAPTGLQLLSECRDAHWNAFIFQTTHSSAISESNRRRRR